MKYHCGLGGKRARRTDHVQGSLVQGPSWYFLSVGYLLARR